MGRHARAGRGPVPHTSTPTWLGVAAVALLLGCVVFAACRPTPTPVVPVGVPAALPTPTPSPDLRVGPPPVAVGPERGHGVIVPPRRRTIWQRPAAPRPDRTVRRVTPSPSKKPTSPRPTTRTPSPTPTPSSPEPIGLLP